MTLDDLKSQTLELLKVQAKDLWDDSDSDFWTSLADIVARLHLDRLQAADDAARASIDRDLDLGVRALISNFQSRKVGQASDRISALATGAMDILSVFVKSVL